MIVVVPALAVGEADGSLTPGFGHGRQRHGAAVA